MTKSRQKEFESAGYITYALQCRGKWINTCMPVLSSLSPFLNKSGPKSRERCCPCWVAWSHISSQKYCVLYIYRQCLTEILFPSQLRLSSDSLWPVRESLVMDNNAGNNEAMELCDIVSYFWIGTTGGCFMLNISAEFTSTLLPPDYSFWTTSIIFC